MSIIALPYPMNVNTMKKVIHRKAQKKNCSKSRSSRDRMGIKPERDSRAVLTVEVSC
jgi:hypothetical protein